MLADPSPLSEVEIKPSQETFYVPPVLSSRPAPQPSLVKQAPVSHAPPPGRVIMRRAISTQENTDYETQTVDRRTYSRGGAAARKSTNRGSFYQSGTQSAYGSRDTTPERTLGGSRKSPYPVAPPSMIISPSMTPRRAPSVERDSSTLTESDMNKLYAKLGEIDRQEESKAIVEERGKGIRVLMKSVSVDTDEIPDYVPSQTPPTHHKKTQPTYNIIAKMHGGLFEDAPLSQTLPASIRIGELVITPGIKELTRIERKVRQKRSESVSPRTARREFYQNYPRDSSAKPVNRASIGVRRQDSESDWDEGPAPSTSRYDSDTDGFITMRYRYDDSDTEGAAPRRSRYESDVEDMDTRSSSTRFHAPKFLKNVTSRRKLFSSKRSMSVESSVGSSVMTAGVAAPSRFFDDDDDNTGEEKKKHKKKKEKKSKEEKAERKEEKAEKKERKSREEKEEKRKRKEEKERERSERKEEKKEKKEKKKRSASVDVIARFRLGGDKKDGTCSNVVSLQHVFSPSLCYLHI